MDSNTNRIQFLSEYWEWEKASIIKYFMHLKKGGKKAKNVIKSLSRISS
jgi:hypothetical protein